MIKGNDFVKTFFPNKLPILKKGPIDSLLFSIPCWWKIPSIEELDEKLRSSDFAENVFFLETSRRDVLSARYPQLILGPIYNFVRTVRRVLFCSMYNR